MKRRASYSEAAYRDLDEIWNYIANDSVDAADRWTGRLRSTADRLAEGYPILGGRHRRDIRDPDILCWRVGAYVIAYRVVSGSIQVSRILHSARDFTQIEWR